jgi:ADP-heptose:LPS heptosyltransferase
MPNLSETSESDSPKVIAVKLPFDLEERILAFPFLHALSDLYPKADLHFITPKTDVEVLNLLPFKAYYHLFDEDEIRSVLDVHPYTANASIYNVDLFVNLTNSFPDACLGLGLRAKKRVGFSDNWKTLVLTHKTKRPVGHHLAEDFLALFPLVTGTAPDARLRVTSRPLARTAELPSSPYYAVNLAPLRGPAIESEWIELLSQFEGQRIVLFASEDQVQMKLLMETFLPLLPKTNAYEFFTYKDQIELGRMLAYASGLITYQGAGGALGAYVGTRVLVLYDRGDPQRTGPFNFLSDVAVLAANIGGVVNPVSPKAVLRERITFNMNEVYDRAAKLFNL